MAGEVITAFRVSARRACDLVGCDRGTFYYRARRRDVAPLRMRLRELAAARPRFGYRRLHILLRREGWRINAKKTYRLYREEALGERVKRRKKRASQLRVLPVAPTRPNERWAMDFMADRLDDGRRIRILTIEDVFTRECLAVEVDTSLVSGRVVAAMSWERYLPKLPVEQTACSDSLAARELWLCYRLLGRPASESGR